MKQNTYRHLDEIRKKLGKVRRVTIDAASFSQAHRKLAEMTRKDVWMSLTKKLQNKKRKKLTLEIRYTRTCLQFLQRQLSNKKILPAVRSALEEYYDSFLEWTKGLRLSEYRDPKLEELTVDYKKITPLDLAYWIQNENIHCQTGMIRGKGEAIHIWHTEEEPPDESFVTKPLLVDFLVSGETLTSYIHPLNMPATGFGWGKDFFHVMNSYYVYDHLLQGGNLAHTACWVIWRLGVSLDTKEVIRNLFPLSDGCVIYTVRKESSKFVGERHSFGFRELYSDILPDTPFSYFFQATLVTDSPKLLKYQYVTKKSHRKYRNRIERNRLLLSRLKNDRGIDTDSLLHLLKNRWGDSFAYCNEDVKMHFVASFDDNERSFVCDSGPALDPTDYKSIII